MKTSMDTVVDKLKMDSNRDVNVSYFNSILQFSLSLTMLISALTYARQINNFLVHTHPDQLLFYIVIVEAPVMIASYSVFRRNRNECSYCRAMGRGLVGLVAGAVLMALGAIILGAPVGMQYMKKTIYWSLMMSTFTFVPTACVFGSSWKDWQRLFASTKPSGILDYMICIPAHGAVIGAWLGAWPMPLDWERPWQEWPISVSYGGMAGYIVGIPASFGFMLISARRQNHFKGE